MNRFIKSLIALHLLSLPLGSALAAANDTAPNVLVTIKPIHSLVSRMMKGIAEPVLLMKGNQSLHHYNLRPSERRLISQASLIFWVGSGLEAFLPRLLSGNNIKAKTVSLIESKDIVKLNVQDRHEHDEYHAHQIDPHIWLSSQNAIALTREIANQLINVDPEHKKQYEKNRETLIDEIRSLSTHIKTQLKNSKAPYITFHNAIQYFENEFNLNNIASIQTNTEASPSAHHISEVIQRIRENNINCLFYNQPEQPNLITSLQAQTRAKAYAIDPAGVNVQAGEEAWFEIMQNVASNLSACLNK